jgi:hypothetical protein
MRAATSWEQGQENEKQRRTMADKLNDAFNKLLNDNKSATQFQIFQAGYTGGAVSMRERAMKAISGITCNDLNALNTIKNAIGQLSDIPQ